MVALVLDPDGAHLTVPFTVEALSAIDVLVRPLSTLTAGTAVLVSARSCAAPDAPSATRRVLLLEPCDAPTELGVLALGEPLIGPGRPFTISWTLGPSAAA